MDALRDILGQMDEMEQHLIAALAGLATTGKARDLVDALIGLRASRGRSQAAFDGLAHARFAELNGGVDRFKYEAALERQVRRRGLKETGATHAG